MGLDVCATGLEFPLEENGTGIVRLRTGGILNFSVGREMGTRVASARRRTKPLREGPDDLPVKDQQLNCQDSSATVTNPGLIPVDTNANLVC